MCAIIRHTDKHLGLIMTPLCSLMTDRQTDGRTDGRTDRRTDGRYQVHYLPGFAVDKYYGSKLLFAKDGLFSKKFLYDPFWFTFFRVGFGSCSASGDLSDETKFQVANLMGPYMLPMIIFSLF